CEACKELASWPRERLALGGATRSPRTCPVTRAVCRRLGRGTEPLLALEPRPDNFPGKRSPSEGWAQTLAGRLLERARRVVGPRRIAPDPCRGRPGYSQSRPRRGGSFRVASP